MVVPVVVDDVIADGERRPEWHARATEHPKIIQTGAAELGLCLFPQHAFLGRRDGLVPGVWRPGKDDLVEGCCDAFADHLLEQRGSESRPAEDPDAVVDLMGCITWQPQVQGAGERSVRCLAESKGRLALSRGWCRRLLRPGE